MLFGLVDMIGNALYCAANYVDDAFLKASIAVDYAATSLVVGAANLIPEKKETKQEQKPAEKPSVPVPVQTKTEEPKVAQPEVVETPKVEVVVAEQPKVQQVVEAEVVTAVVEPSQPEQVKTEAVIAPAVERITTPVEKPEKAKELYTLPNGQKIEMEMLMSPDFSAFIEQLQKKNLQEVKPEDVVIPQYVTIKKN